MKAPEQANVEEPTKHRLRGWIPSDDAWIDRALYLAQTDLDARGGSSPLNRSGTIGDDVSFFEVILKMVDALTMRHDPIIQTKKKVRDQYLKLVRDIPEVVQVILVQENEGQSLLTVIDTTPFEDEPRNKVFEAQIQVMQEMETPLLGFHLVNIRELPEHSLNKQGSLTGKVLWRR